ncbi:MAG TPA: hypothetical protein VHX12_09990, partial [Acidisoma sp.]|nr:hypothetical protein [Acidisoma sp.]
ALLGPAVRGRLWPLASKWTAWACALFILGGTLLTVSALINPGHYALLSLGKAHAKIARASSIVLTLGMAFTLPALLRLPPRHTLLRATAVFLAVGPMTIFLLCRLIIPIIEAHAPPEQRAAIHDSVPASLAFWEWIGSATVYIYSAIILVLLPKGDPALAKGSRR